MPLDCSWLGWALGAHPSQSKSYDAVITVEPIDSVRKAAVWKITAIDLREEQRVDPNTANRPVGTMP